MIPTQFLRIVGIIRGISVQVYGINISTHCIDYYEPATGKLYSFGNPIDIQYSMLSAVDTDLCRIKSLRRERV